MLIDLTSVGSTNRTARHVRTPQTGNASSNPFQQFLDKAVQRQAAKTAGPPPARAQLIPPMRSPVATTRLQPTAWDGEYSLQKVGRTARAPMAMFANGDELLVSTISRNGISKSPIYSYDAVNGLQQRGQLPDEVESGNYGFTDAQGIHVIAEAWNGMVEYVARSPEGPWVRHEFSHLNPHAYKNLKWGFGFSCPETGQQYLGFGNDRHPGVVLASVDGQWQTLAAPEDMLFPTSMGVITSGENEGTRLVCSSTYGETKLHAVDADGVTRRLAEFDGWSYMTVDHDNGIAYVASEAGQVYWSSVDDLENWEPATCMDADGNVLDTIGRAGEINVHPGSGQVILPAADSGRIGQNHPASAMGTNLYAASLEDGVPVFRQIDRIEGAGLWELRTAAVGSDLFLGTGMVGTSQQDASPGGIYRIGGGAALNSMAAVSPGWGATPAGMGANAPLDAVSPRQIQWMAGGDAASWPVETELAVSFRGNSLIFDHEASWSRTIELDGESLAGNFWIGTRSGGGAWQMCPFEWFREGQENCRAGAATEAGHLLGGMRPPQSGDEVLFMVSTPARGGQRTDNQRSRIISARWP